jgi:hypothetical protein
VPPADDFLNERPPVLSKQYQSILDVPFDWTIAEPVIADQLFWISEGFDLEVPDPAGEAVANLHSAVSARPW